MKINNNQIIFFCLFLSINLSIVAQYKSGTGVNCSWTFNTGVLTINGKGELSSYQQYNGFRDDITDIVINDGITIIQQGAYYEYKNLKTVSIPASVISIEKQTFSGSYYLNSINVSSDNPNYTSIDGVLFDKNISALIRYPGGKTNSSYFIPNTVKSIEQGAFHDFFNLAIVTIPNSVTHIDYSAFTGVYSLSSFNVDPSNLNYCSIDDVLFDKDRTILINYPASKPSTSYTVPNTVKSIIAGAFILSDNLTSINIPNSVINIEHNAFRQCSNLSSINVAKDNPNYSSLDGVLYNKNKSTLIKYPEGKPNTFFAIPNSVSKTEDAAFSFSKKLTSITIPTSLKNLGGFEIFSDINNILKVYLASPIPPFVNNHGSWKIIRGISKSIILFVPIGSTEIYRSSPFWGDFFYDNIQEIQYDEPSPIKQPTKPSRTGELKKDPNFKVK